MTKDTIEKIRTKWQKLSRYSLKDMLECDFQDLVRMVQVTYGYSRLQAERECHDFQITLKPVLNHDVLERVGIISGRRKFSNS